MSWASPTAPGRSSSARSSSARLPGVSVEIAYPTYTFAGVLCTHGHYLDPHARLSGSRGDRLLTKALWSIATGGPEDPKTIADYESVITLLTEWLYIAAQMPHGTHAQRNVFRAAQRAGTIGEVVGMPVRGAKHLAEPDPRARWRGGAPERGALRLGGPRGDRAPAPRAARAGGRLAPRPPTRPPAWSRRATPPSTRSRRSPRSSRTSAGTARPTGSSSPTPTSRSPTSARATTRGLATGTPAAGSTSPTSARARPTPATCATAGPAAPS